MSVFLVIPHGNKIKPAGKDGRRDRRPLSNQQKARVIRGRDWTAEIRSVNLILSLFFVSFDFYVFLEKYLTTRKKKKTVFTV